MNTRLKTTLLSFLIIALLPACAATPAIPEAAVSQVVPDLNLTNTPLIPSTTFTSMPTSTSTPTATIIPTSTPDLAATSAAATDEAVQATQQAQRTAKALSALATQQAEDELWSKLVDDGTVTYAKGDLYTVDDFEESWAQRMWYRWWSFDYDMSDFVLLTHVAWGYPAGTTDEGGCGFAFRIKDTSNHLVVFLTTHNSVQLGAMNPSGYKRQSLRWSSSSLESTNDPSGEADLLIVAQGEIVTAYVNGEKAFQWVVARTNSGDMGYTIVSGTNAGTGTTCTFSNTKVWELNK